MVQACSLIMICRFWDYHSGNRFQDEQTIVQPGSLESEAGINCMSFDVSGSRLITGEVDKTIKCKFNPCLRPRPYFPPDSIGL